MQINGQRMMVEGKVLRFAKPHSNSQGEWFEDVVETQRENRQLLRQGIGDAREVVERAGARVPQFLRRNRLVASRDGATSSEK